MTPNEYPVVEQFREILIWPFEIANVPISVGDLCQRIELKKDGSNKSETSWVRIDTLDRGTTAGDKDLQYSEFVYFHPFVQRVLYPKQDAGKAPLIILARKDIESVTVTLGGEETPLTLDVKRVHLYLFASQTGLLAVEVENRQPLALSTVQQFADQFRRAYAPYHRKGKGGLCPEKVEWIRKEGASGPDLEESDYEPNAMHGAVFDDRTAPVAGHWRSLLAPLEFAAHPVEGVIAIRQLEDERILTMLYLGMADPFAISRGDFVRICFCDGKGDSADYPYAPRFLKNFEQRFCYDRFWNPPDPRRKDKQSEERRDEWRCTRYLCSGYNFAVVTRAGEWGDTILNHFRHHYFQIGVLAHFHRASLLKYSRRLTEEVDRAEQKGDGEWEALIRVRREFADFVNQYWFREVSNQDQPKELFRWWSARLGNRELFSQLCTEAAAVDRILLQEHERQQEKVQKRQQDEVEMLQRSTDRLTNALFWLTGLALVLTLVESRMMQEFYDVVLRGAANSLPGLEPGWPGWKVLWLLILLFLLWAVYKLWLGRAHRKDRERLQNAHQGRGS